MIIVWMDTVNASIALGQQVLKVSFLAAQMPSCLLCPPAAAPTPPRQKEHRCREVMAALPSRCPNSGIHPTSC